MVSSPNVLESAPPVGPSDQNGVDNPSNLADVLKKRDELRTVADVKRGRGRPRKNPAAPGGPASRVADVPPDLFTADSVRPFAELPFGVANVWFKTDAFTLDPRESDTLSHQGALVANLYAPGWNPKAVALAAFALGFASITTKKLMVYLGERAEKKKAESDPK